MKRNLFLVLGFLITNLSFGQVLKFQAGASVSDLDWELGGGSDLYTRPFVGYAFLVGADYLEKKHVNLSTNIGLVSKGGKANFYLTDSQGNPTVKIVSKAKLYYVTANTLLELKFPVSNELAPFISAGPRVDYLVGFSDDFKALDERDDLRKFNYGLLLGAGIKREFSNRQVGLRADYYLNFDQVADWPNGPGMVRGEVRDKTLTLTLTLGLR